MFEKCSSEIQDIFGLSRDDVRRLENEGLLKPIKRGQGKAAIYGEADLFRLLDIKIYLLAGYRIADMSNIITEDIDSDTNLDEQIYLYKKRILMLEFIKGMKAYLKKIRTLSAEQYNSLISVSINNSNLSSRNANEFFDVIWDMYKLLFIADYLSQRTSFKEKSEIVSKRVSDAYITVKKLCQVTGNTKGLEELKFNMAAMAHEIDEEEVKEFVDELVDEYQQDKEKIIYDFISDCIIPITKKLDVQTGDLVREFWEYVIRFLMDYFFDKNELYCIFINVLRFLE